MIDPERARKHAAWVMCSFVIAAFVAGAIIATFYRESTEDLLTAWGVILGGMAATSMAYLMGMVGPETAPKPKTPPEEPQVEEPKS